MSRAKEYLMANVELIQKGAIITSDAVVLEGGKAKKLIKVTINEVLEIIEKQTIKDDQGLGPFNDLNISLDSLITKIKEMKTEEKPRCPECLTQTSQEELDIFGGLCENCATSDQ